MNDNEEPAPDINGTRWVLFRRTGKELFEYKEVQRQGKRAILLFTSHQKASQFALRYAKEYLAITLESLELWIDFFKRRAAEGIDLVQVDPIEPTASGSEQQIDRYLQSLTE